MEEVLGKGASLALELSYGRSRASAWLAGVEERARFTLLVAEDNGGISGGGGGSGGRERRVRFSGGGDGDGDGDGDDASLLLPPLFSSTTSAVAAAASKSGGGDPEMNWARLCMQHSDMVLVVGEGGGHPGLSRLERTLLFSPSGPMHLARVDLVLLHAPGVPPKGTRAWFSSNNAPPGMLIQQQQQQQEKGQEQGQGGDGGIPEGWTREITHHHHIRGMGSSSSSAAGSKRGGTPASAAAPTSSTASAVTSGDVARLARFITGRAVGVVLGGGGSRGLAHLGLLKQLVARGIPIDVIGGASQGCFMAAAWATTENIPSMSAKVGALAASVGSTFNILRALTLPLVSLTSGAHFDDLIRSALGGVQIEDIPGPRFFAVSLNATDGALAVHSAGPLWRYVRASMGVLKLLPPVFDRETKRLLVDGGYVSNLPVDVCHAAFPGTVGLVFACDVENKDSTANWLDISEADYGGGGALGGSEEPTSPTSTATANGGGGMWGALTRGGNPDSLELSGWWVAWRATLAALGLGPPMRIPYTDDLFLQVSYMMHYSSLRTLLSEEGYDGAMKEPQGASSPHGHQQQHQRQPQDTLSREHRKPALCYIRPKVGKFGLLDYHLMGKIVDIGEEAAVIALRAWERRWEVPALRG